MSRTRQGRKSWQTRVNYAANIQSAAQAIANAEFKYSVAVTKAMVIERTDKTFNRQIITSSQAYAELRGWCGKSFTNISDLGMSDFLVEMFLQGTIIYTGKASYRLWNAAGFPPGKTISKPKTYRPLKTNEMRSF